MTQHHTFTPALTAVGKTQETAWSQALDELHLGSGIPYPHYVDRQELTISPELLSPPNIRLVFRYLEFVRYSNVKQPL